MDQSIGKNYCNNNVVKAKIINIKKSDHSLNFEGNLKVDIKEKNNKIDINEKDNKETKKLNKKDLIKKKFGEVKQFLTFMFVGAVNTSLEILTLNILWWITGIYSGNINYIFKFIALIICSVVGYMMNKKLTFKSKENNKKAYTRYAIIFALLSFIEAIIIVEMTKISVSFVSIALWANIVSFFASATTGIANFGIAKFFVFKDNKGRL